MLCVIYAECHKKALYAECRYAECHYVVCHDVQKDNQLNLKTVKLLILVMETLQK